MSNVLNQLEDEEALKKANQIDFKNQSKPLNIGHSLRKPKIAIETLSFNELIELCEDASSRLETYRSLPEDIKAVANDQIIGTVKFLSTVKNQMRKVATPEQIRSYGLYKGINDYNALKAQVSMLENELNQHRSSGITEKEVQKLKNTIAANQREILIHINFKRLVKGHIGESIYLSLIREASVLADCHLSGKEG
ncbi:hypothetical protein A1D06_15150 [Acinetobacter baumannii]|uniref:hypothetical protein n=2 Tax=Acinetobacter baumannii TaxID=470 RepID=UPI0007073403|nr:hypothetical protein [Acinetobacter baumannii]KQK45905.1 hypothetical protein AQ482_11895 [Acinetobacter baumannii]OFD33745.1 hypothetical protein A1D06_15150 [Acinetobacter baumannii]